VSAPRQITYRWARRIAISVVGGTVLLFGIALIVLPGPAFVVIPVGLAILGLEFAWARRWLRHVKERSGTVAVWIKSNANGLWSRYGPGGVIKSRASTPGTEEPPGRDS
jgi:uncharacterized protein (TIGR02611 family)